ncbi:MAG: adenosylmethionine--8-amino-7-oxononanoate transaminase [bacterium]|nr:adenosylmethionine--8-amino-7-oxononanoate transaminase [bacterium]
MSLEEKDKKYIWHPFTQMKDYCSEVPLIIEKGKGVYLYDIYGNKYIDGVSSLWLTVHGHQKKELNDAFRSQLKKIAHSTLLGLSHPAAIELAEKLINIAPKGLTKLFYSDNGATSVEIALKIAFQYWKQKADPEPKKKNFIAFKNAYHGDTVGAVSVGGIGLFHQCYRSLLFKTIFAEYPYCYRCKEKHNCKNINKSRCVNKLEILIKKNHNKIAGLIIEPLIQGAGGMIVAPPGFLDEVRRLCDKYNILLIADEVATGFGRTGTMFACERENVIPDIMCIAKGITGGYIPLAATLVKENIYKAFLGDYKEMKTFFHGHSYTGNPIGCAVALANLKIFKKEETLKRLIPKIEYFKNNLEKFIELEHVGDIRQCGMMVGLELVKNKRTKVPYLWDEKIGIKVTKEARKNGLIIRPLGNVIVLMPPLSILKNEIKAMLDIVHKAIKKVTEEI